MKVKQVLLLVFSLININVLSMEKGCKSVQPKTQTKIPDSPPISPREKDYAKAMEYEKYRKKNNNGHKTSPLVPRNVSKGGNCVIALLATQYDGKK